MTQARYNKIISLNEEENMLVEQIRKDKVSIVAIFRKGLEFYAPKITDGIKKINKKITEQLK